MEEKIIAVHRMQEYIKEHLYSEITVSDFVKESLYSFWYSRKIFIELVGVTPSDYQRKLRLRDAAIKLRDQKAKILDIALESGFNSVDGFQRAFFKEFKCNPKEYQLNSIPIPLYTSYDVLTKYKEKKEIMKTRKILITEVFKNERKVIIKRGVNAKHYMTYCEEVGCDVWGILESIKSSYKEPLCMWIPKELIKDGTSEFVMGREIDDDYNGIVPEGFEIITIPESNYLLFNGEPFEEVDYEEAIKEVWDAIDNYNFELVGYKWNNNAPRIQMEPIGKRGYIELVPVKK